VAEAYAKNYIDLGATFEGFMW